MNTDPTDAEPTNSLPTNPEKANPIPTGPERADAPTRPEPAEMVNPEPTASTTRAEVRIRRVPKFGRFLVLGGGLGAVVTFILTASFPSDPHVGFGPLFGYFLIYGVPAGVVLGALIALALDRISNRRGASVIAEHTTVDPLPEPTDEDPR
jgi:hypothetical protein